MTSGVLYSRRRRAGAPPRLLVVDSDLGSLATFVVLLRRRFHVDTALTGRQAISRLALFKPRLLILDAQLPDLEGVYILQALRARYPACPAVVVTELGDHLAVRRLTGERIDGLFEKISFWAAVDQLTVPLIANAYHPGLSQDIAKAIDYVRQRYATRCTVDDISAYLAMSPSSLAHKFRAQTTATVRGYVIDVRVEVAKLLLRHTDDKLEAIAQRAGFCDSPHLCRTFRCRHLGRPDESRATLRDYRVHGEP